MSRLDPVVLAQGPLGRVPEILDPVDGIAVFGEALGMVDALAMKG